nr:RecName: Full=Cysteine-rich venom protein; Short=CRVP; AltName: Full=Cysteine-rich secretory protein; Short=CRISP [Daboia russelii]
SVDFDSESPR